MYVVIVGAGKVGWNLARELINKRHEVTVIEADQHRYAVVEQELEHSAMYGDGSELWVLERSGIERADLVVAVTGDDEDNILISQVAREKYGVERVVARCNNPRNLQHFELLGVPARTGRVEHTHHHSLDVEAPVRDLRDHEICVVAVGGRDEGVRPLDSAGQQRIDLERGALGELTPALLPAVGLAPVEQRDRLGILVEHGDLVALFKH